MATITKHATLGRNLTTGTDVAINNRVKYTGDKGQRYDAIVLAVASGGLSVDLDVYGMDPARIPNRIFSVPASTDHSYRTWDFT